ncbi:MAG: hypothetical protein WAK17_01305 [Candidatus Nitrosopolaris sp.]|jgi:hypothetical protein
MFLRTIHVDGTILAVEASSEESGQDYVTGKITWQLIEENGTEHKHKDSIQENSGGIR